MNVQPTTAMPFLDRRTSTYRSQGIEQIISTRRHGNRGRPRRFFQRASRGVRRAAWAIGLRQEHRAQYDRHAAQAEQRRNSDRRRSGRDRKGDAECRLRLPARHAVSLADCGRQYRLRPAIGRRTRAGAQGTDCSLRRPRRASRVRGGISVCTVGWHEAARGA